MIECNVILLVNNYSVEIKQLVIQKRMYLQEESTVRTNYCMVE